MNSENEVKGENIMSVDLESDLKLVSEILFRCDKETPNMPPTQLYNEGWMLLLFLECLQKLSPEQKQKREHVLSIKKDDRYYVEPLLHSKFLPRTQGDKLGESHTHADGVIGNFTIGSDETKGDLTLNSNAKRFIVIEAKMYSKLSKRVTHAENYSQVSRTIACMAEVIARTKGLKPDSFSKNDLGFFVIAPEDQIEKEGTFKEFMNLDNIRKEVNDRAYKYKNGEYTKWYKEKFVPCLEAMKDNILLFSWDDMIRTFINTEYYSLLKAFYCNCLKYNQNR